MPESPLPDSQLFPAVMERAMQLVGQKVPRSQLQEIATLFHTVCWEFPDYGLKRYFLVSDDGEVRSAAHWSGVVDGVVTLDASTFHAAAFGKTSFGLAFFTGRLRVSGIHPVKLGKFMPLLEPFLESYQQACQELLGKPA
ncbi:MAG: SCP2 sterol-binding domain-containing protein [Dehalococcoidia bacterium]|nr:SCP2 sterol-binding domain-containing protein [Dehalococcoidia bacterium]